MTGTEILNTVGSLFILVFVIQLGGAIRIYKRDIWKSIRVMTSVSLRSGRPRMLLIGGIVVLIGVIFQILPIAPILMTGLGLVGLGGACLPPGIVYLGVSRAPGFSFVNELMFAIAPTKVAHLLNTFETGAILGEQAHMSEYRVSKGWQQAVWDLCEIVPLIFLDTRVVSPPVLQEAQIILRSGQRNWTVFLVNDDGSAPVLSAVGGETDGVMFVLTPREAIRNCGGIGWRSVVHGRDAFADVMGTGFLPR